MLHLAFRRVRNRCFATTAFTVRQAGPSASEQTLFIVGLNKGKFFGQDGAEEGLKLLERIADHHPEYHLLFGLNEKELSNLEDQYQVQGGRLTPSRDLALVESGEVVPIMQAGMVDKRPREALGRSLKTTQGHVAWRLWRTPSEALRLYRLFWRRKNYTDAAKFRFWTENLPRAAHVYFVESAELIAVRTVEHLIVEQQKGRTGSTVLTVSGELFAPVVDRCRHYLGEDAVEKLDSPALSKQLKETAAAACQDVPDMTPFLVLIYLGFPMLALHQALLFCEYLYITGVYNRTSGQDFDLVTGNRE